MWYGAVGVLTTTLIWCLQLEEKHAKKALQHADGDITEEPSARSQPSRPEVFLFDLVQFLDLLTTFCFVGSAGSAGQIRSVLSGLLTSGPMSLCKYAQHVAPIGNLQKYHTRLQLGWVL